MTKPNKKVLVVEDDSLLLDLYRLKLTEDGYEVFIASNGEDGFKSALANQPQLILLDILMPKVDGYTALKNLKSNQKTKKIPVVIFSNLSQKEEIEKGLKLGADDYVVKTSLTPSQLADKVKDYF